MYFNFKSMFVFFLFFGWLINNGEIYAQHVLNKEGPTSFNLIIFIN